MQLVGGRAPGGSPRQISAWRAYPHFFGREWPRLERIALAACSLQFGISFLPRGFREKTAKLIESTGDDDFAAEVRGFHGIPDGHAVLRHVREPLYELILVEVEDGNLLTPQKLHAYIDLWHAADQSECWTLKLIIADRYGRGAFLDLGVLQMARIYARHIEAEPLGRKYGDPEYVAQKISEKRRPRRPNLDERAAAAAGGAR